MEWLIVAIRLLAGELTRAALCFGGIANASLGRFFVVAAHFHFAEEPFALHLFLQRTKCLVDIIITDNNFYQKDIPPSKNRIKKVNRTNYHSSKRGSLCQKQ